MGHAHSVIDADKRFVIDPITREIRCDTLKKVRLMQYDHNSERITFECPRNEGFDGHDMAQCNRVEIHYLNIDAVTKAQKSGLYVVDDLKEEDDETAVCSWLISGNATQLVGPLRFIVRYLCMDDGVVTYSWNTAVCSLVSIGDGINASELFEEEYVDVIEQWKDSVMTHFAADLAAWKATTAVEVREEAFRDIAVERERIDLLSTYVTPQMFGAKGDGVTDDTEAFQAAVDSLGAEQPLLVIPYGVYNLTQTIVAKDKANVRIIGVGRPVISFASQDDTTSGFYFSNYKDIEVSGLNFVSTRDKTEYPPAGHGTVGYNSSNILALYLTNGENATFRDNAFSGMQADYWIVGANNRNILVDGWVSENASMPTYCSYLDGAEFRHSKITPATEIGSGNHAFYISVQSKGVRIIDCECEAKDNTFSSLISHYDAHDINDESIQPTDLLVRDFRGKGARLYVGNYFASVRFENVEFEQIYETYLTNATEEDGAVYSGVECVLSPVKELVITNSYFKTLNAALAYDGPQSERMLIDSSTLDLGTERIVMSQSKAIIRNCDIICGTFIYAGYPQETLDVYVSGCRINATTNYVMSRRGNNNGVIVFANNVITGSGYRFFYSAGTSDCTGVTLLNNYLFNMSETHKLGSAEEIANIVALNNYLNGSAI